MRHFILLITLFTCLKGSSQDFPKGSIPMDQRYYSPNRQYFWIFQGSDGNLVVYKDVLPKPKDIWSTKTDNKNVTRAEIQTDGNLVLRGATDAVSDVKFQTHTNKIIHQTFRVSLVIHDDGNLLIKICDRQNYLIPIWCSFSGNFTEQQIAQYPRLHPTEKCPADPKGGIIDTCQGNGIIKIVNNVIDDKNTYHIYAIESPGSISTNDWCASAKQIGEVSSGKPFTYTIPRNGYAAIKVFSSSKCNDTFIKKDIFTVGYCSVLNFTIPIN